MDSIHLVIVEEDREAESRSFALKVPLSRATPLSTLLQSVQQLAAACSKADASFSVVFQGQEKAHETGKAQKPSGVTLRERVEQYERELITDALARNDHKLSAVCRELGVGRTTLWRKLRQYALTSSDLS